MKVKPYLISFLFMGLAFFTRAQSNLDSLFRIWNNTKVADTTRLDAIQKFIWDGYLFKKPDSGFYYAQLNYDFAESKGLKKQMAEALHLQGISYAVRGNHFRALDFYQKSLKIREEISDTKGIGKSLNVIGLVYYNQRDFLKAQSYFERAVKIFEKLDLKNEISAPLGNIASIYLEHKEYSKALATRQKLLTYLEESQNKRGLSLSYGEMGVIYMIRGDEKKGFDYIKRSISIAEEISDNFLKARNLIKLGEILVTQKRFEEAKIWCEKGLEVVEKSNNLVQKKELCQCLYETHKGLYNSKKALEYHEKMTVIADSIKRDETIKKLQEMEFSGQMVIDSLKHEAEKKEIHFANEEILRKKNKTRNILVTIGLVLLLFSGGLFNRWRIIKKAKGIIEEEKKRSEELLLNILPADIAEELKTYGKAEARDFQNVSILFTDFVGFTETSEKLNAQELVEEINICFKTFDFICEKYKIEKIKTIGDAYMAAGGLPVANKDSVKNTVLAALEMQAFMIAHKKENDAIHKPAFEMRIGIHTGPIVAGIVGVKKFQYDVWGDTVNTASRIESNGQAGKVNISQSTYELLKDDPRFFFESRGKINAKGKGEIEMYFVENLNKA